jgi:hypothetical protein
MDVLKRENYFCVIVINIKTKFNAIFHRTAKKTLVTTIHLVSIILKITKFGRFT